ncbi:MAG TPA: hypothetical protein VJ456_02115, partial [Acidimicrobiia bacterium]|nr:hypothetical protein [Acidimicrobiia bacterium]
GGGGGGGGIGGTVGGPAGADGGPWPVLDGGPSGAPAPSGEGAARPQRGQNRLPVGISPPH